MSCRVVSCVNECACCKKSIRVASTGIAIVNNALCISIPHTEFQQCDSVCIFLEQPFPCSFNAAVTIDNAGTYIPVVTRSGGTYRIDTDEAFNILKLRFLSDSDRLLMKGLALKKSC